MQIKVSFKGSTRTYTTEDEFFIEIDHMSTVREVVQKIAEAQPGVQRVIKYLSISVNNVFVSKSHQVSDQDEVALYFRSGGG